MNYKKLFYLMLILPILFLNTACSDDSVTPDDVDETEVLIKYLEANGDFLNSTACPAIIKADAVNTNILTGVDQVVIDIRTAVDYNIGHIKGAVNVVANDILSYYETNNLSNKTVVVIACYTGQGAGWATSLLRIMGYNNVFDLKWGMCSWNASTNNHWVTNTSNAKASQFVNTVTEKPAVGDLPKIETGKTEGSDILRARVEAIFAEGVGLVKIANSDVFAVPNKYFVANYWSEDHYKLMHIPGAVQYSPGTSLKSDNDLKTLPTDKIVAVYCYTGQTSAQVAAVLRVIGYDAKSILYGVNGMSYDAMPGTRFIELNDVHDYELVK
ncbi:MAG: hypothetical protein JEY94_08350 [Melioribacteraceae bacterium]|nr:hypothetical protein [Melioribacteraceae bacterium]